MKVICTDMYGRDYNGGRSETVHGENLSEADAKAKADELNKKAGSLSDNWYVVKPDDYTPYLFNGY